MADAKKGTGENSVGVRAESDLEQKIKELDAVKNVISAVKQYPKESQERILTIAGDTLECWTKRTRRTKAEVEAENGGKVSPAPVSLPQPAAA